MVFIEQSGLSHLMLPAWLVKVDAIPKLGSGKNDFSRARKLAVEACAE